MKKISLVIPVYNEEGNLHHLYDAIQEVMAPLALEYTYEIILVNDGSVDNSWAIIGELAQRDERIKAINLSRNFGHQMALTAGYDNATGDAIVSLDADMQDPPKLIIPFLEHWRQGYHIVYARRIDRDDGLLKKMMAQLYYYLLDMVSDVRIPRNVGDCRLIDARVLAVIKQCREQARYLRGIVAWAGFKHAFVDFKRPNRTAGVTGYTWHKMFKLGFDGLTGFSLFPLKIAAYAGVFVIGTGIAMFSLITIDAFFFHVHYPLFKWLVTVIYIFMGVQFLLLWLIGEYIGRIHNQQKERPLYIVEEKIRC